MIEVQIETNLTWDAMAQKYLEMLRKPEEVAGNWWPDFNTKFEMGSGK